MHKVDTREDLPGAICFTQSIGNSKKFWIHPSAIGAVSECSWGDEVKEPKERCEIILRTGHTFYVEGTVQDTLKKLGWE